MVNKLKIKKGKTKIDTLDAMEAGMAGYLHDKLFDKVFMYDDEDSITEEVSICRITNLLGTKGVNIGVRPFSSDRVQFFIKGDDGKDRKTKVCKRRGTVLVSVSFKNGCLQASMSGSTSTYPEYKIGKRFLRVKRATNQKVTETQKITAI